MLRNVLSCHHGLAMAALDTNHLTSLLVLEDVATGTFDLTVGSGVARDSFHLVAVPRVVLENVLLNELFVAEEALQQKVAGLHGFLLRRDQLVLSSALDGPQLLNFAWIESLLCLEVILHQVLVVNLL